MKRLFIKIIFYLGLLAFVTTAVFFLTGALLHKSRLGATYHKQERLKSIDGPKLILIGGSNAHYGINSEKLEKLTGWPVVNMSIQGSIGLKYMFAEIMDELREGDIVILLGEFSHYFKGHIDGETTLYRLISIYPKGIADLDKKQLLAAPHEIGPAIKENFSNILTNMVMHLAGKKSISEASSIQGDFLGHKGKKSQYVPKVIKFEVEELSDYTFNYLKEIRQVVENKKVNLFYGFVPVAESDNNAEGYKKVEDELPPEITLGNIAEYVFPDSFFYDFAGHLMYDKRDIRTEILYQDMLHNEKAKKALSLEK